MIRGINEGINEAMEKVAHARWLMDIGVWEYQDASENGELRLI